MGHGKTNLPEGVEDHGVFQRKFWAAQRFAWIAFGLILVGCLSGAFGRGGYLSRSVAHAESGAVDYPAITRWNAPDDLKVTFAPSPTDRIFLVDEHFFDIFAVEGIDPPQKATLARNGLTGYVFPSDPMKPTQVTFRLQTQTPGLQTTAFGVEGSVAERKIFVFP